MRGDAGDRLHFSLRDGTIPCSEEDKCGCMLIFRDRIAEPRYFAGGNYADNVFPGSIETWMDLEYLDLLYSTNDRFAGEKCRSRLLPRPILYHKEDYKEFFAPKASPDYDNPEEIADSYIKYPSLKEFHGDALGL